MSLKKIIIFVFGFLVLFIIVFVFFGYFALKRSQPKYAGTIALMDLNQSVEIWRDRWAIPHIKAANDRDLYFAMGYVCAQDRLAQMDLFRRAANGTLSEVFGEETLSSDKFSRTIGFGRTAREIVTHMSGEHISGLEAYTQGVNAYINQNENLPLEYLILHAKPESWHLEDSVACLRLLAWLLSMGWYGDLTYSRILDRVGPEKFAAFFPYVSAPVNGRFKGEDTVVAEMNIAFSEKIGLHLGAPSGSNAWVVSGSRTQNGGVLLANDLHLPYSAPSLFYVMQLNSPQISVVGACIPGIPALVVGRNADIAWGITNGMVDDLDFIFLQSDSTDSNSYRAGDKKYKLEIFEEKIAIKAEVDRTFKVYNSHQGPIVNDINTVEGQTDRLIALRWVGAEISDEIFSFQKLLTARDWSDFRSALFYCKSMGLNFVYGDRRGNIGYQLAAGIPVRNYSRPYLPTETVPCWRGTMAFHRLPYLLNPQSGFIVSANDQYMAMNSPFYISAYWDAPYRHRRIQSLLKDEYTLSLNTCIEIQNDVYSVQAEKIVPAMLQAMQYYETEDNPLAALALQSLATWDYRYRPQSVAASVFEFTYNNLFRHLVADDLGDCLFHKFLGLPRMNAEAVDRMILKPDSAWIDNASTPEHAESIQELILSSFIEAVDSLKTRFGDNFGQWRWGNLHPSVLPHPFGKRKSFSFLFNVSPFGAPGGNFTVNNSSYDISMPYDGVLGPCMRQIIDLSGSEYHIITNSGQSGHPFSPHYKDQFALWRNGELIKLDVEPPTTPTDDWQILKLRPAP